MVRLGKPDARTCLGLVEMRRPMTMDCRRWAFDFNAGTTSARLIMILAFYLAIRIFRSPFRHDAAGGEIQPAAHELHRPEHKPYTLAAFVISGMYAGLAGGLDGRDGPILLGAERMQWTASGEVVLMTILGGAGTLDRSGAGRGFHQVF